MFHRSRGIILAVTILVGLLLTSVSWAIIPESERAQAVRVSPQYAHDAVAAGRALLVCAYPDQEVCDKVMLENAISLKELEARLPDVKKDQEIIFYCA